MKKIYLSIAALNGLIGTGASALAAHALPGDRLSKTTQWFIQGAEFQLIHAITLMIIAVWMQMALSSRTHKTLRASYILMQGGIIAFSGTLYWIGVKGAGTLGAFHWVTPTGGLLLMLGWTGLIVTGLTYKKED